MEPNTKKTGWTLPKWVGSAGLAAGMLITGAGKMDNAAAQDNAPKAAQTDDPIQREAQDLIRQIKTHLTYIGEIKRPATKEEIDGLITQLGHHSYREREKASKALTEIGYPAKGQLKAALKHPDLEIAVRARRIIEAAIDPVDEARAKKLQEPVFRLGWNHLRPAAKEAVPVLMEVLAEDNIKIKNQAVITLGAFGPAAEPAVPAMVDFFKQGDDDTKAHIAKYLGQVGTGAKAAVPVLVDTLKQVEKKPDLAMAAANALGNIGPDARVAGPALVDAFKNSIQDGYTRKAFLANLSKIDADPKIAVPGLIDAFKDNDSWVRQTAISTLGSFAPQAKESVLPTLIGALKDDDHWVVRASINALTNMGSDAKAAVPALKAFKDSTPDEAQLIRWGQYTATEVRREAGAAVEAIEKTLKR